MKLDQTLDPSELSWRLTSEARSTLRSQGLSEGGGGDGRIGFESLVVDALIEVSEFRFRTWEFGLVISLTLGHSLYIGCQS